MNEYEARSRLGQRIRDTREARRLTQAQAVAPHFTPGYLSAVELGRAWPSVWALAVIAAALRVTPSELLEGITA